MNWPIPACRGYSDAVSDVALSPPSSVTPVTPVSPAPRGTPLAASMFGALAAMGVGAGALASGASAQAALAITGLVALPMAGAAVLASAARGSLDDGEPLLSPAGTTAMGLAIVCGGAGLTVLGALLKATTHHRGLGGVTFAVLGAAALLGVVLASARLGEVMTRHAVMGSIIEKIVIAKAAVILVALCAIGGLLSPGALDIPMMFVALFLGALLPVPAARAKLLAGVGSALCIVLLVVAFTQVGAATEAVKAHGQLAGAMLP